jgi:hypothetical protein
MSDHEAFVPDDVELAELESEDLSDREVEAIKQSQQRPDTAAPDDPGAS